MKGMYIESPVTIGLAIAAIAAILLLVGGLVIAVNGAPVSGADIDRIVRQVEDAGGDGDNTVMVNVQAAAGIGIIQRAESTQAVTKTDTDTQVLPPPAKTAGLPGWQLVLIVAACFLPICALGCWLLFDR